MDSFVVHVKTKDIYPDPTKNIEKIFDMKNHEFGRPLSIDRNKNIIELMKEELGRTIMKEFVVLRPKMYSYLTNDQYIDKKAKFEK